MATESNPSTYADAQFEDLDEKAKEIFTQASTEEIMEVVMMGFIAIAHKTGTTVESVIATCYLSYQMATNPERLRESFANFREYQQSQGEPVSGISQLLNALND